MNIEILNKIYEVIDTKEKITIADSFVVRQNKIREGNGEAKLYVGQENQNTLDFFGERGFSIQCFLLKKDLLAYLDETKIEYLQPEQNYICKKDLPSFWKERKSEIESLPEIIEFTIYDQNQITPPRVYVKSDDLAYKIIRKLSLPEISYITVVKLKNENQTTQYYFKLFADYFGEVKHPYVVKKEEAYALSIAKDIPIYKARKGQGKYRESLLNLCPFCPITMVSDERILIASHIKPWSKSSDFEKKDPLNGFMFTPTFDYLFDRGFLSFTNDKKTKLSPFLSKRTYAKIGVSDNKIITTLPIEGRETYLEYHRDKVFQG